MKGKTDMNVKNNLGIVSGKYFFKFINETVSFFYYYYYY